MTRPRWTFPANQLMRMMLTAIGSAPTRVATYAGDHLAFPTSQRYSYFNAGPALVRFVRVVATQK
jgi:hypothetical protein